MVLSGQGQRRCRMDSLDLCPRPHQIKDAFGFLYATDEEHMSIGSERRWRKESGLIYSQKESLTPTGRLRVSSQNGF
jgi:hypothetical protein